MSQISREFELLKSKIRFLEDRNFILEVKNSVYEDVIKYQLKTMTWFQILLKFLVDHQVPLITALCSDDIISIPNKIISFMETSIVRYEKHLEVDRKGCLNFPPYQPFVYDRNVSSIFECSQSLTRLINMSSNKIASEKIISKDYSTMFISDIKEVFRRHNLKFDSDEFLQSVEASKIIFWLLRDVFSRIPFLMHDFEVDKIASSLESIKNWIFRIFREYTVNILDQQSFAIEPKIYIEPIIVCFLNSINDTFLFKDVIIELMNKKYFKIESHASLMERDVFNRFSYLMFQKKVANNQLYDVPRVDFILDKSDIPSLLVFLNAIFSITDYQTEGDQIANNYLLQNLYLQKFLKSSIEQLGVNIENTNFINPIKVFTEALRLQR